MNVELMSGRQCNKEGDEHQCLKIFPNQDLFLIHYVLSTWQTYLLTGLGHYIIRPRAIEHMILMTTNLMTLGYIYARRRLKNLPNIIFTVKLFLRRIIWTLSRLDWDLDL